MTRPDEAELLAKSARNRKAKAETWGVTIDPGQSKMVSGMKMANDSSVKVHVGGVIGSSVINVAHVSKTGKVGKFRPIPSVVKPSKYKNKKTEVDGIVFDSKKEAARWLELKALEAAGAIRRLSRQVRIPLEVNGTVVAHWVADFAYYEDLQMLRPVWEDVKSDYTRKLPVYRLKKKLVKAIYGVDIKET